MTMPMSVGCTCRHSEYCNHECHGRHCDPTEHVCSLEFLPDEGGLTMWGCPDCSPGAGLDHLEGCERAIVAPAPGAGQPIGPPGEFSSGPPPH
jgi:hypothetical protein